MRSIGCLNIHPSRRAALHDVHHDQASVAKPTQASLLSLPLVPEEVDEICKPGRDPCAPHCLIDITLQKSCYDTPAEDVVAVRASLHIRHLVPTRNFLHVHLPQKTMILARTTFQIPIISTRGAALKISLYKDPVNKTLQGSSFHDTVSLPEDNPISAKLFLATSNRQPHLVQRSVVPIDSQPTYLPLWQLDGWLSQIIEDGAHIGSLPDILPKLG